MALQIDFSEQDERRRIYLTCVINPKWFLLYRDFAFENIILYFLLCEMPLTPSQATMPNVVAVLLINMYEQLLKVQHSVT